MFNITRQENVLELVFSSCNVTQGRKELFFARVNFHVMYHSGEGAANQQKYIEW